MKKISVSLIMILILMFNMISVYAVSAKEYPESRHPYSSNFNGKWSYTHAEKADCLFVTFSEDTYFGPGGQAYYDKEKYDFSFFVV